MKRWAIAGVVVVGVALGILLMPRPDTGGAVATRAGSKLDGPGFVAPNDPDGRNVAGSGGTADPTRSPDEPLLPMDEREAITAKLSTPEANAARQVGSGWAEIRMDLSNTPDDPQAMALMAEVEAMFVELRGMRRNSTKEGWDALEAKQRDLLARVKASPYGSHDSVSHGSGVVESKLNAYDNGTLEIMKIGPAAVGEPVTTGSGIIESESHKVRPQ